MDISKKIKEIQNLPEHMRMRWVWGCVGVSMFFILLLWLLSVASLFKSKEYQRQTSDSAEDLKRQIQDLKQQAPSLKDFTDQTLQVRNEGITSTETLKKPANDSDPEIPQSGTYTDMPQGKQ